MQTIINEKVKHVLNIQRHAWKNGHSNYGAEIDVLADMMFYLNYFEHLNPKQKHLQEILKDIGNLQYGQKLCSKAHKAVRHFIVTLK